MAFSRRLPFVAAFAGVGLVAVASSASLGCSSSSEKESIDTYESELRLTSIRYLGKIADGESKSSTYTDPPVYRAYGFEASGGDEVTVDVGSEDGDAMGWITSSSYTVYAANDDASDDTFDAKVVYKIPAGTPKRSYRAVFRDYARLAATFTVTLSVKAPEPVTCAYGDKTYTEGDQFPSTDGCNTCSCSASGVACTKKACVCDPANEPNRNYIGTPDNCGTLRYTCKAGTRSFQNDCGCGCERL
jgi:hypothetical protein